MIRISAKPQRGFYRAGMLHPHQPVDHPDDAFTAEQLAALKDESLLAVQVIEGEPENAPADSPAPDMVEVGETGKLKEQLGQREAAVAERENAVEQREKMVEQRENWVTLREGEAETREEKTQEREEAIGEREEKTQEREQKFQQLRDRPLVREGILKAAIEKVQKGQAKGDFTKEGEPKTEAVEREAPGMDITASERSQWFAELYPDK